MAPRTPRTDPNRFLQLRAGHYQYKQRIPLSLTDLDTRGTHVRISLKTADLAEARAKRDVYEAADNELWASFILGDDPGGSRALPVGRATGGGDGFRLPRR